MANLVFVELGMVAAIVAAVVVSEIRVGCENELCDRTLLYRGVSIGATPSMDIELGIETGMILFER
jgi:hypothetical protein